MSATDWPDSVPVLTAKDIHRGTWDGPDGTHCLLGHGRQLNVASHKAWSELVHALDEATGKQGIAEFNDDLSNSATQIANVWNRAMRSLGYTEIHEVDA